MRLHLPSSIQVATATGIICAGLSFNQQAHAQVNLSGTSYYQNFDGLAAGLPLGWTVDTGMSATSLGADVSTTFFYNTPAVNTGWNNTSGRFKNVASGDAYTYYADGTAAAQTADTDRALAIRPTGSIDFRTGFVLQIANTTGLSNFQLSFNLQSLDSTAARVSTWQVDYGFGANPAAFTAAAATGTLTTGGNTFTKNTITVNFGNALDNQTGPVYIRIMSPIASTATGSRTTTAIDDYNLIWTGTGAPATNMALLAKTPAGNNIPLSTNALTLRYDNPIQTGAGQINVYKAGNSMPQTFTVPSSAVTIADSTATISGLTLENNTSYYVLMTDSTFSKTGGMMPNKAITDTTYWTFKTVDTVTPPPPTPFTSLNETFTNCNGMMMGNFTSYSVSGAKTWRCSTFGHNDSASVYINGGSSTGVSEANNDWLITAAPLDFSAMTKPMLSLWQKRRFEGTVTRELKISTNYITGTDPSLATWTIIPVQELSDDPAVNVWSQIQNIDLTAYKTTPFYMALTYNCATTGAYELTYDDIVVTNQTPSSIFNPNKGNVNIKVLGDATAALINLDIDLNNNAGLDIQMYDITGRMVYQKHQKAKTGNHIYSIENANIPAGMYVVRVLNGGDYGVVKVMVR